MKSYYVYILASKKNGILYTGITNDIARRVWEHKEGQVNGFTKKYRVKILVYYEEFESINDALYREKCIKRWKREWKIKLIETVNKKWKDLYEDLIS